MKDLLISELRRFRWIAIAAGVANLLLLMFFNRLEDLLHVASLHGVFLFIYTLLGLGLAIMQVGSYRKASQWAWLIHRPLSTSRIFAALSLSALLVLALVIVAPVLAMVIATDVGTSRIVDLRHYFYPVLLLAFAMMAWLAGAHACVSRSRIAIAVLFAPLLLALHMVSVFALLLPVGIALAWLGWITLKSFRANREAPIRDNATLLLTALPLQIGLFLLCIMVLRFVLVSGGILLGTDPLNTDYPPRGGLIETERAEPSEQIAWGLEKSEHPRAENWREQLPLLEPLQFGPWLQRFPVRHQFSSLNLPSNWYDKERNTYWRFSHDRMLFLGRNPESGASKGVFGRGGAGDTTPFEHVPVVAEHGDLLTPHALHGIDSDTETLVLRYELRQGESFTGLPQREFNRIILLTNQRVIVLREDLRAAANIPPLLPDWEIALPDGPQYLEYVTLAELMDGWLVSFVYGNGMRQIGFNQFSVINDPWQYVMLVDNDGQASMVAERDINADFPVIQRTYWWVSPLLETVTTLPEAILDKGLTWPMLVTPLPKSRTLVVAALLSMLLALAAAWWWTRGTTMNASRRRVWLASCLLLGPPAFLSLVLLEPRELEA
ncbi:MAG: hypothetical protein R3217_08330 [Gammaproteobacteria bacterium]|nr:hypothetical protein [Gammaproteobacteria bacterium]